MREKWDADHVTPRHFTQSDELEEFKPAHINCHKDKTREDKRIIAKSNNVHQKHLGIKKKGSGGFQGWRKFNGDVVRKIRHE